MPCSAFPEITFPAPAAVPPTSAVFAPLLKFTPERAFGSAAVPAALVPMKFPWIVVFVPPVLMPQPSFPLITFPAPAVPPPITVPVPPFAMPALLFGIALLPVLPVPMRFPWISVPNESFVSCTPYAPPERTLRSANALPPMRLPVKFSTPRKRPTLTCAFAFPRSSVPDVSVPIKLPVMVLLSERTAMPWPLSLIADAAPWMTRPFTVLPPEPPSTSTCPPPCTAPFSATVSTAFVPTLAVFTELPACE